MSDPAVAFAVKLGATMFCSLTALVILALQIL